MRQPIISNSSDEIKMFSGDVKAQKPQPGNKKNIKDKFSQIKKKLFRKKTKNNNKKSDYSNMANCQSEYFALSTEADVTIEKSIFNTTEERFNT